jgi:fermentation-respiration switch protein FrsA (DUF1100 family)
MITTALITFALLYVALLVGLYVGQRRIQYRPTFPQVAPSGVGLDAETLHLTTQDGETLVAWRISPRLGRPLILYFHGNVGGLELRVDRFRSFAEAGMGVLAIEYRGYAGSTGRPTERGLLLDGEAAYSTAIGSGVAPERIVAMGESLGSGVAVAVASRHNVAALVLDSPYSSIADIAAGRFWWAPVRALTLDPFRNDLLIRSVEAPTLIVHGTKDGVVPIRFGEKLFALANQPKEFWRVEGAAHLALGERLAETLNWIARTVG